ncbi:MAG: 5-dehydro-2-deoxygluconokinase [Actinobacteria bacterium]|nr:MAG: 5-dehydro-2-deoxygluconokinase [Actinomycetota bacterium]
MSQFPMRLDLLAIGRSGVDIYPLQTGLGLEHVTNFGKFLGGSPTNVAVAAARMGRRTGLITAVGNDPFGRFVRNELRRLGVSDEYVMTTDTNTPVTFCEIFPPDNFPLYFYRDLATPDLHIHAEHLPYDAIQEARIFWFSVSGLCAEPSRSAHHAALSARNRAEWTIADLDYRQRFWASEEDAHEQANLVLEKAHVAIGNREECRIVVGETDPDRAADALLERGVEIAIVKQGNNGTLAKTRSERITVPCTPIETFNGLGAGDAFGGSLCHALLQGWDLGDAIRFASTAGAIVASRLECSTAMPTEFEVHHLMNKHTDTAPIVEAVNTPAREQS